MTESEDVPGPSSAAFTAALELVLPTDLPRRAATIAGCATHLAAVVEANQRLNLTRIVDPHEAAVKHVLDSLLPAVLLEPKESVLDLGSGAGFPGVPLHHHRPDLSITLSESVKKRAAFLEGYCAAHAPALTVVAQRAEEALLAEPRSTLIARAVGKLADLLPHLDRARGRYRRILFWKGPAVEEELAGAAEELRTRGMRTKVVLRYSLPEGIGERCILELSHRRMN